MLFNYVKENPSLNNQKKKKIILKNKKKYILMIFLDMDKI
jgi:hypothetical protein